MVEITHGGTWLKWSRLGIRDRNWALLSFATSALAAIPIAAAAAAWGYELGYRAGSGGLQPGFTVGTVLSSALFAYAMLGSLLFALISAVAWWQFSRHQDEMFNRIQNYAIAQAGGWTFAFAFIWWLLELGGWVGALPLTGLVILGTALLIGFWLYAVRRWL